MGRRFRRLSRARRGAALQPPLQFADFRGGDRRHRGRLRHRRRPRRGRADVCGLHRPGRRRDLQPAGQVAVDVGGHVAASGRAPLLHRQQIRRPAFAGLDRAGRPDSRLEGGLPGDALRRQGPARLCPLQPRTRSSSSRANGSTTRSSCSARTVSRPAIIASRSASLTSSASAATSPSSPSVRRSTRRLPQPTSSRPSVASPSRSSTRARWFPSTTIRS